MQNIIKKVAIKNNEGGMIKMKVSESKIMNEMWDYERNLEELHLLPNEITYGSGKEVYWKCLKCGRVIKKSPNRISTNLRKNEEPCEFCSGIKAPYENSILCLYKDDILKYFDFDKNRKAGNYPCNIPPNSSKYIYIYCKEHNYLDKQRVADFTDGHIACKYCNGSAATEDYNLFALFPKVASELKDKSIDPKKILPYSSEEYIFECPICGNSYKKILSVRTSQGQKCPHCNNIYHSSTPELILYYYLKDIEGFEYHHQIDYEGESLELDLYVENEKGRFAVEHDGYHHKNNEKLDEQKNKVCKENGIFLIRIRDDTLPNIDMMGHKVIKYAYTNDYQNFDKAIKELARIVYDKFGIRLLEGLKIDIDEAVEQLDEIKKEIVFRESFAFNYSYLLPVIAEEDRERAYKVTKKSNEKLKCRCPNCGLEFPRSAKNLSADTSKCRKCQLVFRNMDSENRTKFWKRRAPYKKSLEYKNPEIAKFYLSTNHLKSYEIHSGSKYECYFYCPFCKSIYKATPYRQVKTGCRCKECSKKAVEYNG